jgi:SAM-dependent MidA family methyltransferase
MRLALYHPRYGYYTRLAHPPGARGDFYTSPELHPAFGALIARQLLEVWQRLGRPDPFVVEEWGAGSGRLAHDVLSFAPEYDAAFGRAIRYRIVERSPRLRRVQQRALRDGPGRVEWATGNRLGHPNGETAPEARCVLANELLDAFPVHRVVRRRSELREIHVTTLADTFQEVEGPLSTPALHAYFARLDLLPPEGNVAEVNLEALEWLRSVAARLDAGAILVIDYGHPAPVLYSERYPRGTLCTYFRHAVAEDPYTRVGEQDLTAQLDLTSLLLEARACGLVPLGIARQTDFLERLGLANYLRAARASSNRAVQRQATLSALERLAGRDGLGGYWVMAWGRGIEGALHGLSETAAPLAEPAVPAALAPRLGWSLSRRWQP